eukprot:g1433.t1
MLENMIRSLLQTHLSTYFEGPELDNAHAAIRQRGALRMRGLRVKPSVFEGAMDGNIRCVGGRVDVAIVDVPWMNLLSGSIVIRIEGLRLEFETVSFARTKSSAYAEQRLSAMMRKKMERLAAFEAERARDATRRTTGWMGRLAQRIVSNIVVTMRDVHVSLRDVPNGRFDEQRRGPSSFGMYVDEISITTVGGDRTDVFRQLRMENQSLDVLRDRMTTKAFRIDGLRIYLIPPPERGGGSVVDRVLGFLRTKGDDDRRRRLVALAFLLRRKNRRTTYDRRRNETVLGPVRGRVYMMLNNAKDLDMRVYPKRRISAHLGRLRLAMRRSQVRHVSHVLDYFSNYERRADRFRKRPTCAVARNPRAWWRYVSSAVRADVRERMRRRSWSRVLRLIRLRKRYVRYFTMRDITMTTEKDNEASVQWRAPLESLERELTFEEICCFRSLARKAKKRNSQRHTRHPHAARSGNVSSNEWERAIQDALDATDVVDDDDASHRADSKTLCFAVRIDSISTHLRYFDSSEDSVSVRDLRCGATFRATSGFDIRASVQCVSCFDTDDDDDDESEPFFSVDASKDDANVLRVRGRTRSIVATVRPAQVARVRRFFSVADRRVDLSQIRGAMLEKIAALRARSSASIADAMRSLTRRDVHVHFGRTTIRIQECSCALELSLDLSMAMRTTDARDTQLSSAMTTMTTEPNRSLSFGGDTEGSVTDDPLDDLDDFVDCDDEEEEEVSDDEVPAKTGNVRGVFDKIIVSLSKAQMSIVYDNDDARRVRRHFFERASHVTVVAMVAATEREDVTVPTSRVEIDFSRIEARASAEDVRRILSFARDCASHFAQTPTTMTKSQRRSSRARRIAIERMRSKLRVGERRAARTPRAARMFVARKEMRRKDIAPDALTLLQQNVLAHLTVNVPLISFAVQDARHQNIVVVRTAGLRTSIVRRGFDQKIDVTVASAAVLDSVRSRHRHSTQRMLEALPVATTDGSMFVSFAHRNVEPLSDEYVSAAADNTAKLEVGGLRLLLYRPTLALLIRYASASLPAKQEERTRSPSERSSAKTTDARRRARTTTLSYIRRRKEENVRGSMPLNANTLVLANLTRASCSFVEIRLCGDSSMSGSYRELARVKVENIAVTRAHGGPLCATHLGFGAFDCSDMRGDENAPIIDGTSLRVAHAASSSSDKRVDIRLKRFRFSSARTGFITATHAWALSEKSPIRRAIDETNGDAACEDAIATAGVVAKEVRRTATREYRKRFRSEIIRGGDDVCCDVTTTMNSNEVVPVVYVELERLTFAHSNTDGDLVAARIARVMVSNRSTEEVSLSSIALSLPPELMMLFRRERASSIRAAVEEVRIVTRRHGVEREKLFLAPTTAKINANVDTSGTLAKRSVRVKFRLAPLNVKMSQAQFAIVSGILGSSRRRDSRSNATTTDDDAIEIDDADDGDVRIDDSAQQQRGLLRLEIAVHTAGVSVRLQHPTTSAALVTASLERGADLKTVLTTRRTRSGGTRLDAKMLLALGSFTLDSGAGSLRPFVSFGSDKDESVNLVCSIANLSIDGSPSSSSVPQVELGGDLASIRVHTSNVPATLSRWFESSETKRTRDAVDLGDENATSAPVANVRVDLYSGGVEIHCSDPITKRSVLCSLGSVKFRARTAESSEARIDLDNIRAARLDQDGNETFSIVRPWQLCVLMMSRGDDAFDVTVRACTALDVRVCICDILTFRGALSELQREPRGFRKTSPVTSTRESGPPLPALHLSLDLSSPGLTCTLMDSQDRPLIRCRGCARTSMRTNGKDDAPSSFALEIVIGIDAYENRYWPPILEYFHFGLRGHRRVGRAEVVVEATDVPLLLNISNGSARIVSRAIDTLSPLNVVCDDDDDDDDTTSDAVIVARHSQARDAHLLRIEIARIIVSFVHDDCEVACLTLASLLAEVRSNTSFVVDCVVRLGDLQVDNMVSRTPTFPTLVRQKESRRKKSDVTLLELRASTSRTTGAHAFMFSQNREIAILVDTEIVFSLLDLADALIAALETTAERARTRSVVATKKISSRPAAVVDERFESFRIDALRVSLTFVINTPNIVTRLRSRTDASARSTAVATLLRPLGVSLEVFTSMLSHIDQCPLRLGAFAYPKNAPSTTSDTIALTELSRALSRFYASSMLMNWGRIVGSASFLGNPVGLARGLGEGVQDFFVKPGEALAELDAAGFAVGAIEGSASLVKHITSGAASSASSLLSTLVRGLESVISFDLDHAERLRTLRAARRPSGVIDGFVVGLELLSIGAASGVRGLAYALAGRSCGDAFGIFAYVRSVLGASVALVVKPCVGVGDLVGKILQGIGSNDDGAIGSRVRLPRRLPLMPYSEREVCGTELMRSSLRLTTTPKETYVYHAALRESATPTTTTRHHAALITTKRIAIVIVLSKSSTHVSAASEHAWAMSRVAGVALREETWAVHVTMADEVISLRFRSVEIARRFRSALLAALACRGKESGEVLSEHRALLLERETGSRIVGMLSDGGEAGTCV